MVISSKEPLVSLEAEVARLGLSVGKKVLEPKAKAESNLASKIYIVAVGDTLIEVAANNTFLKARKLCHCRGLKDG